MNKKMINGMTVSRWACVNFSRSVQENVARGFCNELGQMCEVSGMVIIFIFHSSCIFDFSLTGSVSYQKAFRSLLL